MLFPFSFWNKPAPAPPSWLPTDLASLAMWHNGAQADSVQVDGDNRLVEQADLSGNGVNKVPQDDAVSPLLVADVLDGKALLRLSETEALKLATSILPFDPGWDYQGPCVRAHVLRASVPNGSFGSIRSLFNSGFFQFISAGENSGDYDVLGVLQIATPLVSGPSFLRGNWPGNIYAQAPQPITAIVLCFKGTTRNEGKIFFFVEAQAPFPEYLATLDLALFNKSLCCSFVSGLGTTGTEMYEAEQFLSTEDSPTVPFSTVRDYLLRWCNFKPFTLALGDSLTGGFGIGMALAYPYQLSLLQTSRAIANVGINGRTVEMLIDDWTAYASLKRPGVQNVVNLWVTTNNIADGDTADSIISALTTLVGMIRGDGWKCSFLDCIPRNFSAPFLPSPQDPVKEAIRIEVNSRLAEIGADSIFRLTQSAPFNDPAAYADTEFYNVDQVHLTAAGYLRVAQIINSE